MASGVTQPLSELTIADFQKLCKELVSRGLLKEGTCSTAEELQTNLTSSLGKDEAYNVINASLEKFGYLVEKESSVAREELEELRSELISMMSFSRLHQLFDDLVKADVVSNSQIEEILFQSPDVRQQTESLIDFILHKVPEKSSKMLFCLGQRNDILLHICQAASRVRLIPQKQTDAGTSSTTDTGEAGSNICDIDDGRDTGGDIGDIGDFSDTSESSRNICDIFDCSDTSKSKFSSRISYNDAILLSQESGDSSDTSSSGDSSYSSGHCATSDEDTSGTKRYGSSQSELLHLKPVFIAKVPFPVLNQLLENFWRAHVLSHTQIEEILSLDRREQRPSLINMVLRKGPEASWKMLFFLKLRYPSLFEPGAKGNKRKRYSKKRRDDMSFKAYGAGASGGSGLGGDTGPSSASGGSGPSSASGDTGLSSACNSSWLPLPGPPEFMTESLLFRLMVKLEIDLFLSPEEINIIFSLNSDIRSKVFHLNHVVHLKGPEASKKMLYYLRRIEPRLFGHCLVEQYKGMLVDLVRDVDTLIKALNMRWGVAVSDEIKAIRRPQEKMSKVIDNLKSVEQKRIFYSVLEEQEPQALDTVLKKMETDQSSNHFEMLTAKWLTEIGTVAEDQWSILEPEMSHVGGCTWYSFCCVPGQFECRVSGLRWICKDSPLSFQYRFGQWCDYKDTTEALQYMAAGPLLDITVNDGQFDEVYLPHCICTTVDPTILEKFAVLHSHIDGVSVENVSDVTPSHVKLPHTDFSENGPLLRFWRWAGFPVFLECKVLIYRTKKTFLTLHVYLIPSDSALEAELQKKAEKQGYERIEKPYPQGNLELDAQFNLKTNVDDSAITPKDFRFKYETRDPNFFEVFIERPGASFTLRLENATRTVWSCIIRQYDYYCAGAGVPELRTYDEELRRVSTDFAERVSAEVTNQLLSDLLGASLNDGERDAIIEGHVIQTHRARALIDTIRKKGPEASRIMIFHLERRDSTLHGLLGLPRIPTPQAAKIPQALKQETSLN